METTCTGHRHEEKLEFLVSPNYLVWRNDGLFRVYNSFEVQGLITIGEARPSLTKEPKRKRISNENEL